MTPGALLVVFAWNCPTPAAAEYEFLRAAVGKDWMLQHVRYAVDGGSANSA